VKALHGAAAEEKAVLEILGLGVWGAAALRPYMIGDDA
jgi:hypothetical protein